jgi:hypothetical protein
MKGRNNMDCTHDTFRCTNGVFYCLKCGAVIPNPYEGKETPAPMENAAETPEKPTKRERSKKK